jgi:peptide/nickel transport system ATP-binding protein
MIDRSTSPLVEVEDLTVTFQRDGHAIRAVNGISFSLKRGEVLTVIGESGSGKSVMLRTVLGLIPGYATIGGKVMVKGIDIASLDAGQRSTMRGRDVSLIFQEPATAFDPVYTIGEQIAETIVRHEGVSQLTALARARDLLDLVAIPSAERRLRNFPHEMSGGMRQRAMIALALACNPSVLLADEPTTALDATVQIQLLVLLRKLQRELDMALIFVTHDMGVAAEISDRVAVMYAGRFIETGTVEDVLLDPRHPYTSGLLSSTVHAGMRGRTLQTIVGSPPDLRRLPKGCSFAPRCSRAVDACGEQVPASRSLSGSHSAACLRLEELATA